MAAPKATQPSIGSSQWIQNDQEQIAEIVEAEVGEFSYSVRNELEWLNEHMAEVFSANQIPFADIFKTPGKLRGKTPRTARKRDAPGQRQPLTDIFAPNVPAPASEAKNAFLDKVAQFQIPEDASHASPGQRPKSRAKSPQRAGKSGYTDSGYHGMTEDEMEIDSFRDTEAHDSNEQETHTVPLREDQPRPQPIRLDTAETGGVSDDSFVSAKEGPGSRAMSKTRSLEAQPQQQTGTSESHEAAVDQQMIDSETQQTEATNQENDEEQEEHEAVPPTDHALDVVMSGSGSETSSPEKPLQRKSSFTFAALPAREPLTAKRNSQRDIQSGRASAQGRSLGNKSLGRTQGEEDEYADNKPEASKMHNKTSTQSLHERIMMLGKTKEPRPSKSIPQNAFNAAQTHNQLPVDDDAVTLNQAGKAVVAVDDSDDDWIAPSKPLEKQNVDSGESRPDMAASSLDRPSMHQKSLSTTQVPSPTKPEMVQYPTLEKTQSVSNLDSSHAVAELQSTTPSGSPPKKQNDGPLSASKNRLYSVLKSAKSIFASSASASAAAKLEAHNNSPSRSQGREEAATSKAGPVFNMPGAMYSEKELPASPARPLSILSGISRSPSKKSSKASLENEKKREKEMKAQQKANDELAKVREKERQRAAKEQDDRLKAEQAEAARKEQEQKQQMASQSDRPTTAGSNQSTDGERPAVPPKGFLPFGKSRAPSRPVKPSRDGGQPSKPAPMSILVASQSSRLGQSSNLGKSQREGSVPPPPPPKNSLRPSSAQGNAGSSTAPSNSRVRALEAAARKKEADERAAQKKAEQKRELERKRAAKAEEERRAEEERKAAEQQRVQEAKMLAQKNAEKQAAEAKRREQMRLDRAEQLRLEQQRLEQQKQAEQQRAEQQRLDQQRWQEQQRRDEEAEKARAAHELAEAIKRERNQQAASHPRGDVGGTLRQLTKNIVPESASNRPPVQPNPAKPMKRPFQTEEEGTAPNYHPQPVPPPQRPGMVRGPPSYQQNDAKRRRTNEEEQDERRSVMAPPKRPSNMRKASTHSDSLPQCHTDCNQESTLAKFPHGYAHAPPPGSHHGASMFKAAVTSQHQLQHGPKPMMPGSHPSQMVQVSNARIPFAENNNPPQGPPVYQQHPGMQPQYYQGGEMSMSMQQQQQQPGQHPNKYKTPVRAPQATIKSIATKSAAKSSPMYPNGDSIALPEIATDSEDEDSEDEENDNTGFRAPSWVASPALRDLLTQQQLVDPESVFGPISELKMDEVFRNGKNQERLKRFRDRGSSAAWIETGDAVTSAEKRKDMELRERVVRDGGWRYDPNI